MNFVHKIIFSFLTSVRTTKLGKQKKNPTAIVIDHGKDNSAFEHSTEENTRF